LTHKGLKGGIEATPDERTMTAVVVEKALIREAGVISVGLVEKVGVTASTALHDQGTDILASHRFRSPATFCHKSTLCAKRLAPVAHDLTEIRSRKPFGSLSHKRRPDRNARVWSFSALHAVRNGVAIASGGYSLLSGGFGFRVHAYHLEE
jgi:hypothetical protein